MNTEIKPEIRCGCGRVQAGNKWKMKPTMTKVPEQFVNCPLCAALKKTQQNIPMN